MLALHPQYIVDETSTQQAVIIKIDEWQNIIKKLEEYKKISIDF